ncbi:SET domain-containing protein [Melanomma pulvis-pyrius CBS 109.77]|uniref:SET domain-containing protein n=1 Tax=Melanomma pulvis-pyrius CBS 109.77 TaxID=1314802 RepID=A0A6A6WZT8_9PLEO|nr:SET domain-containing protein [Melanomma pulvis-pyrius CBS 109.77]
MAHRQTNRHNLEYYFWYTSSDGVKHLATSTDTPGAVPTQFNDYAFTPSRFAQEPYPATFPPGGIWPPKTVTDLLVPLGPECTECVGDICYTDTVCEDPICDHTFENWKAATQEWQEYFELRMTEGRGVGVYTKRAFDVGDVLGWYAGELKTTEECKDGDYFMEMEIGPMPWASQTAEETVFIDASIKGNWTRFINHSCEAYATFCVRRVGNVRIMVVEAVKDIPANTELTIDYGPEYYGMSTSRICQCGAQSCVGVKKLKLQEERRAKMRMKTCRKDCPPQE